MGEHYNHFTEGERSQLYVLCKAKIPKTEIAELLNRSRTAIYNELNRNSGKRGYRPKQAQRLSEVRRKDTAKPIKMDLKVVNHINEKLNIEWSPEQISNVIIFDVCGLGVTVSHETIYKYVREDKESGGWLYKKLRHGQKKRRNRKGGKDTRGKLKNRIDIDERPKIVEERSRIGDWEADLICGTGASGYLVTLLDRTSRQVLIGYSKTKFANSITNEILRLLQGKVAETITFDNGKEFAGHELIAFSLKCKCFFAKPYHSWERGANENVNGLIRQYFPKKMSFANITKEEIQFVQYRLNTRPRKCLDFKPPDEVYFNLTA